MATLIITLSAIAAIVSWLIPVPRRRHVVTTRVPADYDARRVALCDNTCPHVRIACIMES